MERDGTYFVKEEKVNPAETEAGSGCKELVW
jgi:hypothetical protein